MARTIMAVGGHIGDMELTVGGYLCECALKGDKIITVALTAGERGNPAGMSVAEYRKQKVAEAEAFAKKLGGEAVVFEYVDGELPDNEEVAWKLCDVIRKYKPDMLFTHWKNSMHKDHIATHYVVGKAQFYAGLCSIERELPPHYARGPYYAENWEDSEGFVPYTYFRLSKEAFALWQEAVKLHWFVTGSTSFRYFDYYSHLKAVRGMFARGDYAEAFQIAEHKKFVIEE